MIRSIHYLRGIAALFVVFFHFRSYLNDSSNQVDWGEQLFSNGAFGVDLFFIISGFIICFATQRPEPQLLVSYVLKRFFRIYPLLFCSLLLFYFAFDSGDNSLWRSLIPLHADYSSEGPFFGYNLLSPVWTLTYELFFYALFFVALALSQPYRKELGILLVVVLFLGFQLLTQNQLDLSAYQYLDGSLPVLLEPIVAVYSSPMILEFAYGMLIYMLYERMPNQSSQYKLAFTVVSVLIAIVAIMALYSDYFYGHGPLQWGVPAAFLIMALLAYEKLNGLAKVPSLIWLGDISFSLYLTHILLIKGMRKYGVVDQLDGVMTFIVVVVLSLLLSSLVYRLIEKQGIRICRDLLRKNQNTVIRAMETT